MSFKNPSYRAYLLGSAPQLVALVLEKVHDVLLPDLQIQHVHQAVLHPLVAGPRVSFRAIWRCRCGQPPSATPTMLLAPGWRAARLQRWTYKRARLRGLLRLADQLLRPCELPGGQARRPHRAHWAVSAACTRQGCEKRFIIYVV